MAEIRSALPDAGPLRAADVSIAETAGHDLVQLAAWPESFAAVGARLAELLACPMPADTRTASARGDVTVFQVGPERLWIVGRADGDLGERLSRAFDPGEAAITALGHSRTVLRIEGAAAAALLARGVAIDLDPLAFPAGSFAQTRLHHTSVLLHRTGGTSFDLYVPRSLALAVWDWLGATLRTFRG